MAAAAAAALLPPLRVGAAPDRRGPGGWGGGGTQLWASQRPWAGGAVGVPPAGSPEAPCSPSPWRRGGRRGRSRLSSCRCPGQTCKREGRTERLRPGSPAPTPHPQGRQGGAPGAHGHLLGVVDVGAVLAAVAPTKAVVVHAVLLLPLPPPLPRLPDDGQAALDGPAEDKAEAREPGSREAGPTPAPPPGTYLARERLQLPAGSSRPGGERRGHPRPSAQGSALPPQSPQPLLGHCRASRNRLT